MGELIKLSGTQCSFHIKHDLRELSGNHKAFKNESIDTSLSSQNYSLVDRGATATEVNEYRKNLEKEIFQYNRKNLVHAVELVVQCPSDCPDSQKADFFQEVYNYVASTLPMGERCIFVAEVHRDEHKYVNENDISKDHIHIMYTPAVPDKKHDGFEYKLCADELTKRAKLKAFHPGLQKHLDDCGIHATVYTKKSNSGRRISLSVAELKAITDKTGYVFPKSISLESLAHVFMENETLKTQNKELLNKIQELEHAPKTTNDEWGHSSGWGQASSWNNDEVKNYE